MSDPIITIQQGRGAWQGPQSEAPRCRKCGAVMAPGIAMAQTYTGSPDDLGGDVVTMSPGGSGKVVSCRKCTECGWSVTGGSPQEAETVAWHSGAAAQIILRHYVSEVMPLAVKRGDSRDSVRRAALFRVASIFDEAWPPEPAPAPAPAVPVEGAPDRIWAWEGDGQDGWDNAYATIHHVANGQVEYVRADIAALRTQPAPQVKALADAAKVLDDHYERGICYHENTHRGGAIWTICDDCGGQWADDSGGFKPFEHPAEVIEARRILSALSGEAQP